VKPQKRIRKREQKKKKEKKTDAENPRLLTLGCWGEGVFK
jgi:hypothetical protein